MQTADTFFLLVLACLLSEGLLVAAARNGVPLTVGESHQQVLQDEGVSFVYTFNRIMEGPNKGKSPALRLAVRSDNASIRHPLLFTVRQTRGVTSWPLPYVESGYKYLFVERTLCPFLNIDMDDVEAPLQVFVEVSTSSLTPVSLTMHSYFVQDIYLKLNTVTSITASPSSPAYLLFNHPPEHSRVRVAFSSTDDTKTICAIASIQKSYCPVVELLDNPDHRGTFQTMRSQAAINVELVGIDNGTNSITDRQQTQFMFFYIVVSVFPSNDTCASVGVATSRLVTLEVVDNFDPVSANLSGVELTKNINITIEPNLPDWAYGVGVVVPTVIYLVLYFIAIGWILFADWIRYNKHPLDELVERRKQEHKKRSQEHKVYLTSHSSPVTFEIQEMESARIQRSPSADPEAGLTSSATDLARQLSLTAKDSLDSSNTRHDSSEDEPDGPISSPTHLTPSSGRIQTDSSSGFKKFFLGRSKNRMTDSDRSIGQSTKRPSMLSVLLGRQYNSAISMVSTPSPKYHHSPSTSMAKSSSLDPRYHRYQSVAVSENPYLHGHQQWSMPIYHQQQVTQSLGSPAKLQVRSRSKPYISPATPLKDQVVFHSGQGVDSDVTTDGQNSVDHVTADGQNGVDFGDQMRPRSSSYCDAVEKGHLEEGSNGEGLEETDGMGQISTDDENMRYEQKYLHDHEPFPINMCICELSQLDDASNEIQKRYNSLSWYLISVIIFYAIPAYQLVITYQQLLTISGNQDICYHNSLCSHSWRVTNSLTLSAFNNIYSNIGYVLLGFLFILITYRRRSVYYAVEKVANNPSFTDPKERVGVPEHFGIYYAIGFSLIAEGFMSVAYHICPSKANYQFDTTFMFVMAFLGIFKLLKSRSPDLHPRLHELLVLLAAIILMVVVGVLYSSSRWFYAVFFIIHVIATFMVTLQNYYRWQIFKSCASLKTFFKYIFSKPFCPPKQIPKLVMVVLSNIANWIFAVCAVIIRPADFGTFFLMILLVNFILLLFYYAITKCIYSERPSIRPLLFLILSLIFWGCGVYFYTQAVTDWLKSPAVSRDGNRECVALFYDSHDMWHFTSALGLFFSFLMLMTLDDNTEGIPRTELRVF